jgi:predicted nucleic acid-binding protein
MNLPVHHIDTSVIIEPENTDQGRECTKYLHLVGYKYRGRFSIPMLGELLLIINRLDTPRERYELLDLILQIINQRKITYFSTERIENNLGKIRNSIRSLTPVDSLLLACAISDKANFFVTIDNKLLRNSEFVEDEFGIEIKHPKDLIRLSNLF